jgi:DNA modification methylase
VKPYYEDESVTLYHADCREVIPTLPAADAVIADPPYNIGKAEWDTIPDYEEWSAGWIRLAASSLSPGGAFWIFHSDPVVLGALAGMIPGRKVNSFITLDKSDWGIAKRYANAGTKTFPASAEYATYSRREVYADEIRVARLARGLSRAEFDTIVSPSRKPTGLCYRWEMGERVPQPVEVALIEREFGAVLTVPTFNNGEKHSVVWKFPQVNTADHPTPKPLSVVARMIQVTTNPGDVVLDPFAGSGTTLRAAKDEGRKAIGVEVDERYCEIIANRMAQDVLDFGSAS